MSAEKGGRGGGEGDIVGCRMIHELERVVLTTDLPEHALRRGDVGAVVLTDRGGAGYEVEFVTHHGETIAVVTVLSFQVRPIERREIAHARVMA